MVEFTYEIADMNLDPLVAFVISSNKLYTIILITNYIAYISPRVFWSRPGR